MNIKKSKENQGFSLLELLLVLVLIGGVSGIILPLIIQHGKNHRKAEITFTSGGVVVSLEQNKVTLLN